MCFQQRTVVYQPMQEVAMGTIIDIILALKPGVVRPSFILVVVVTVTVSKESKVSHFNMS